MVGSRGEGVPPAADAARRPRQPLHRRPATGDSHPADAVAVREVPPAGGGEGGHPHLWPDRGGGTGGALCRWGDARCAMHTARRRARRRQGFPPGSSQRNLIKRHLKLKNTTSLARDQKGLESPGKRCTFC